MQKNESSRIKLRILLWIFEVEADHMTSKEEVEKAVRYPSLSLRGEVRPEMGF